MEHIVGQYIIVFKDQADGLINSQAAQKAINTTQDVFEKFSISNDSLLFQYKYALKGFSAKLSSKQVEELKKDPRIDRICQARMFKLGLKKSINKSYSTIASFSSQITPYGVDRVQGPLDGTGKKAWIIDTGIDMDNPDLNIDQINSKSFISNQGPDDSIGHGTHVAGIIAAKDNTIDVVGVAAGAKVVAVKVCLSSGCPENSMIQGIDYVAGNAAPDDIVNMSIWGPADNDIDNAVINAANSGVRFSLIAGNAGANANNYSPGRANNDNIWTVSASDGNDQFASFSNYGNPPIEFAAPGVNIPSLAIGGGITNMSGTSMAAPHVAGLLLVSPEGTGSDDFVSSDPDGDPDPIAETILTTDISGPTILESGEQGSWQELSQFGESSYSYDWYYRDSTYDPWMLGSTSTSISHTFDNMTNYAKNAGIKIEVNSGSEFAQKIYHVLVQPDCAQGGQIGC